MIRLFKSLLGAAPAPAASRKPITAARSSRPPAAADWRAVALVTDGACQAATGETHGRRYLLREAPRLPLSGCASPEHCSCRYRKFADRRGDDRRALGGTRTAAWYAGAERRQRRSRRAPAA